MEGRKISSARIGFLFSTALHVRALARRLIPRTCSLCTQALTHTSETIRNADSVQNPRDSLEVLRRWGCSEGEISTLIQVQPGFLKSRASLLEHKLGFLHRIGFSTSDLVKMVRTRPRALQFRLAQDPEEFARFLLDFFGSRELILKAAFRSPALLSYKPSARTDAIIRQFEDLGVGRKDFVSLVLARPSILSKCSLTDEKLEYIRMTGVPRESKLYKHIVAIFSFSRLDTIREKAANIAKFGFEEEQVYELFGRSPFLMTMSAHKVQRNMTFVVGEMKLPAQVLLRRPHLAQVNLETVLKPRYLVGEKMKDMGLDVKMEGPLMFTAIRMSEIRFLEVFINRHPVGIRDELLEYYNNVKNIRRLGETSKRSSFRGFTF